MGLRIIGPLLQPFMLVRGERKHESTTVLVTFSFCLGNYYNLKVHYKIERCLYSPYTFVFMFLCAYPYIYINLKFTQDWWSSVRMESLAHFISLANEVRCLQGLSCELCHLCWVMFDLVAPC